MILFFRLFKTECRNGGMADAVDSKSTALKSVRVQVPLAAYQKEADRYGISLFLHDKQMYK